MTIATRLNNDQRERIARNIIGYDGPMAQFNNFLESDQAKKTLYNNVIAQIDQKMMARKGGMPRKLRMDQGGDVPATEQDVQESFVKHLGRAAATGAGRGLEYYLDPNKKLTKKQVDDMVAASPEAQAYKASQPKETPVEEKPAPVAPTAPTYTDTAVSKIGAPTAEQQVQFTPIGQEAVSTIEGASPAVTAQVTEPTKTPAVLMDAREAVTEDVRAEAEKLKAPTGIVSENAQAVAQTVTASDTAVKNVNAAKIDQATQVANIPPRTQQADEMVSGPAVKMAEVELALDKAKAAQLDITEDMTLQGQLNKLMTDFDAGNPPAWASASMRAATAVLNQRGLGASSLAGQAIVQATLESAIPIAAQDAKTVFEAGVQNLSARQQVAVLTAQQRAQFLGQEFDQDFQTRVLNAARVADIADMNFNADVQIALENARLTQTVDLANLNNRQALVMAKAAQIANLESANLNNRQQAEIQNAEAFLKMDLTNLDNQQQTALFKTQQIVQSLFTDAAAENARLQFNASTENQVNQFFDSLDADVKKFNVQQKNGMEQFRVSAANAIAEFNANVENNRLQFNASNGLVVSQANAQWRQQIATIDTAAQNQTNQFNAQNALAITMREYENAWQEYRDNMEFAWKSGETALERENNLAIAQLSKEATIEAAELQKDGDFYGAIGAAGASMGGGLVDSFFSWLKGSGGSGGQQSGQQQQQSGQQQQQGGGGSTTVGPGGGGTGGVTVAPSTGTSSTPTQPAPVDPIDDPNITIGPGGGGTGGVTQADEEPPT